MAEVNQHVQHCSRDCGYGFCFNRVAWQYANGTLTLRGQVGSFYLKEVLQTMLRDIKHVQRIVNEVDVVSATGLSSDRCNRQ